MRHLLPVDDAGFTTRDQLKVLCEDLGRRALIELLDATPALVADLPENAAMASAAAGGVTHFGEEPTKVRPSQGGDAACEVGFLLKAPGAPFPGLVTLGRAKACDLQLCLPTVSKIHAYFMLEGGSWYVVDQQSMNKTRRNGEELRSGARTALEGGDSLQFGLEFSYRFVLPHSLVSWITCGSSALRIPA